MTAATRPPALLSAQPSAEPDQQEVWRAPDPATGSVAAPLAARAHLSRETADPTGQPGAQGTRRVLGSAVKGLNLMPVNASKAQEGELKSGKIRFYLRVALQIF